MSKKQLTRDVEWTIPAGESITRTIEGEFIHIRRANGPVLVEADSRGSMMLRETDAHYLPCGEQFSRLILTNDNSFAVTVFAVVGFGERRSGGSPGASRLTAGTVAVADAVATQIAVRNEGRRGLYIRNGTGTDMTIGEDSGVVALTPGNLPANSAREIRDYTGEVWAFQASGGPLNVLVEEVAEA